jgi:hypothetical protein
MPVVGDRRHPADVEPRLLADLVPLRLADAVAELVQVDSAVAGAEAEERRLLVDEHQRLDDLTDLDADGVCRLPGSPGGVGQLSDLGIEAELL